MKEKAYDEARDTNYNPFDGLVHNGDGTKNSWLDDEVVGGVNTGAWIMAAEPGLTTPEF
jgi:hypothetical protein